MHGRALVVVPWSAKLHPSGRLAPQPAPKVHALVVGTVDVAGPEQSNVSVLEGVLLRPAAVSEIDVVRLDELQSRPAFEVKMRRRWLVQLGFRRRNLLETHRRVARLEDHLGGEIGVAVKDVLVVHAGISGYE